MSNERLDGWKKQEVAFGHAKDREFGPGLRKPSLHADLGVAEATGGQFRSHVIKVNTDRHTDQGTTGMHRHDHDFQFNHVISGSITFVIDGAKGERTFHAGDTYLLPGKIPHSETWVSDDFEVLEIYAPANAGTEQLTPEIE